jgi:hypothetical protein
MDSRGRNFVCTLRRAEMDFRRQTLFILVALTSVLGCRHDEAVKRELLENKLRVQEDCIYDLKNQLEDTQRELDRSRGITRDELPPGSRPTFGDLLRGGRWGQSVITNEPSGVSPGTSSSAPANTAPPSVVLPPKNDTAPPSVELPGGSSAPPFRAPIMSPPDPTKPEGLPAPGGSAPPFKPGGASFRDDADGRLARNESKLKEMSSPKFVSPGSSGRGYVPDNQVSDGELLPAPLVGDQQVKTITLNRRSGGWNSDGKPGDEGIAVVIEPRNARGEVVAVPGAIRIVIIDAAIPDESGRSMWDFAPADAAAMVRPTATGGSGGLHFELPWMESPPAHSQLKLFVRYTTDDGRKLEVNKDIFIDLGRGAASAWKDPSAQPILTAVRAVGPMSSNASVSPATVQAGAESSAVAPTTLNWASPKSRVAPTGPEVLAPPTNAQPLEAPSTGPTLGPTLIAPGN